MVVGAGVVGCCCARELARCDLSVLVVEAGLDIASGAMRANSGIVHAGFDPKPGTLKARYNAAGINADKINNMLSSHKLKIQPKRGEYLLYQGHSPFSCTMFQAPTAAGKGVLVGQTVFGNVFIGPNSAPQKRRGDVSTTAEGLAEVLGKAKKSCPDASGQGVISAFAGLRASNVDGGDFVVGQAEDVPGLFNAACIDSPGLASAPAIAEDLARGIADYLETAERDDFNPTRQAKPLSNFADEKTKARLLADDPGYGIGACTCYGVTQAEVISVLRGKLPVYSLDAIKWRTGATMGPCQDGRCLAKIAGLVAGELGLEARVEGVCIERDGSEETLACGALVISKDMVLVG